MITIRTTVLELGLYRDDYEAFVAALQREGFDAQIEEPEEYRSLAQTAGEVGIYLAGMGTEALRAEAIDAIRRAAQATISRPKPRRGQQRVRHIPVMAYGERAVLLSLDLPAEPDESDEQ